MKNACDSMFGANVLCYDVSICTCLSLQLLAFLLKTKSVLVSSRTFQLVLYMCSSLELLSGPVCLPNTPAFQALLCNLEVLWASASQTF